MNTVCENYRRLLDRIGEASVRSGRAPESVRLIGVTKRVDASRIREAVDCGLREIGENRIQEAEQKLPLLEGSPVRCHLIGHLQANKAGKAVTLFSYVQSLDSIALAQRLSRLSKKTLPVLIQVKLGDEESKTGVTEDELDPLIEAVGSLGNLELQGLMAIPPLFTNAEDARPYFQLLWHIAAERSLPEVSMGMSHDFEVAIEEGATMIRVGTALFGERT